MRKHPLPVKMRRMRLRRPWRNQLPNRNRRRRRNKHLTPSLTPRLHFLPLPLHRNLLLRRKRPPRRKRLLWKKRNPLPPPASNTTLSGTTLTLRFGGGEEFTINMYDNDTANKIAEYVGTAAWQLPIYHYDDYDGWESFQYYDIPSRYDIPDGSQSVTSQKAGAVYYSHPNRIILFYQDANISTEYTPVGYIDFSQDLVDAVENNPVVEGWGNKLIFIQP